MFRILVAEDDKNLRKLMAAVLRQNGYEALTAEDGQEALERLHDTHVDLLISDIMMPNMSGYQLTKELRRNRGDLPILMVTAKESMDDKRKGFLLGTDDYMVKPIDMDELLLRVSALLRRARISNERRLLLGEVELDYDSLSIRQGELWLYLPVKEFMLLFKLLSYPGRIFTRRQLMDEIWGPEVDSEERTVDVHIKRLREKTTQFREFEIQTVRGLGYRADRPV